MKNKEYWEKCAERNILESEKNAKVIADRVQKLYETCIKDIENEINRFYVRFGREQEMSLEEVNKLLRPSELKSFHKQAREYYNEAYANNWQDAYTKRMRILSAKAYMSRLEELKVGIYHALQRVYEYEVSELDEGLVNQYNESFYKTAFDIQHEIGFGANFTAPNPATIRKALNTNFYNQNYTEGIWHDRDMVVRALNVEIPRAFVLGENPKETAKRIRNQIEPKFAERTTGGMKKRVLTSKCERVARTAFNHIANEASFESTIEQNKRMNLGYKEYMYLATLDSRTSETCRDMDGKVFPLKEKKVGVNFPPLHSYCRSTYTIVRKDDDDHVRQRIAKDKSGKYYYVPADMTYREWEAKYR